MNVSKSIMYESPQYNRCVMSISNHKLIQPGFVCWLVVSQGRICSDNFTCCHTEDEVADPSFLLTQSHYTDTGPTSPSTDPITSGAWRGSHWSANFEVTGMTRPRKKSQRKRDSNPGSSALEADALTTRPTRRSIQSGRNCGSSCHDLDSSAHAREFQIVLSQLVLGVFCL